jgi:hypothetical protein
MTAGHEITDESEDGNDHGLGLIQGSVGRGMRPDLTARER